MPSFQGRCCTYPKAISANRRGCPLGAGRIQRANSMLCPSKGVCSIAIEQCSNRRLHPNSTSQELSPPNLDALVTGPASVRNGSRALGLTLSLRGSCIIAVHCAPLGYFPISRSLTRRSRESQLGANSGCGKLPRACLPSLGPADMSAGLMARRPRPSLPVAGHGSAGAVTSP